jgi:DNA-binding HxlR family transcriptional regulator
LLFASANIRITFILQVILFNFLMKDTKRRSECPISSSLDIWGDKWSLLIVRDLMFSTKCTYGDFLKSEEKIATNILASRLQMLEASGIIVKEDHPDSKAKVLYKLTEKGVNLLPVMVEINLWADQYFTLSPEIKKIIAEMKKDKEGFIRTRTNDLRKSISS